MSESFNLMVLTINNYLTILKITEKDGTLGSHKSLQNLMKDFRKVSKFMKTQNEVDIINRNFNSVLQIVEYGLNNEDYPLPALTSSNASNNIACRSNSPPLPL